MGSDIIACLEVICMTDKTENLKAPVVQSEKSANTDIIYSCLLRPIERGDPPFIVSLFSSKMVPGVGFLIVCFLEYLVSSDTCLANFSESVNIKGSRIDIYPSYLTVSLLHTINHFCRMGNIISAIIGMFTIHQDKPLLTIIFESFNFLNNLIIS